METNVVTLSIERRASQWGDRIAVIDVSEEGLYVQAETIDEVRVSYTALAEMTRVLATDLDARGIDAGDVVCVCSRDRVAVLALVFACYRLGATLAPISHRLTPATVERPLSRLEPELVVHERAQRDLIRDVAPSRSVALDDLNGVEIDHAGTAAGDCVGPRAVTTDVGRADDTRAPLLALHGEGGTPVVRFDAAAVEWNCITAAVTWGLGRADLSMTLRPLATHDGLFRLVLPSLYVGGSVAIDRAFDPGDALEAIDREPVSVLAGHDTEFRDLLAQEGATVALESVAWAVSETPVDEAVRTPFEDADVPLRRVYARLECPNALTVATHDRIGGRSDGQIDDRGGDRIDEPVDSQRVDPDGAGNSHAGTPMFDCATRLVDDGDVVTGPGRGTLQLSGPVLASGYVREDTGTNGGGRFVDGWFDTEKRVRRDEAGRYDLDWDR